MKFGAKNGVGFYFPHPLVKNLKNPLERIIWKEYDHLVRFNKLQLIMKKIFIVSILTIVLQSSTCFQRKYCENDLKFRIDFNLTPKDTFRIGDTLWVQAMVPDTMFDLNSQQALFAPNMALATEMVFGKVDRNTSVFSAHLFNVVPQIGNVRFRYPAALECIFDTIGSHQRFYVGLIPQKEGIYRFTPNFTFDAANQKVNVSRNECTDVVNLVYRTNQGQCNFHLLKQFLTDSLTEAQYSAGGVYGFTVIPR